VGSRDPPAVTGAGAGTHDRTAWQRQQKVVARASMVWVTASVAPSSQSMPCPRTHPAIPTSITTVSVTMACARDPNTSPPYESLGCGQGAVKFAV